ALVVVQERQLLQVDLVQEQLLEPADLRGVLGGGGLQRSADGAAPEVAAEAAAHGMYAVRVMDPILTIGRNSVVRTARCTPSAVVLMLSTRTLPGSDASAAARASCPSDRARAASQTARLAA